MGIAILKSAQIYIDSNKAATLATYSVNPETLAISEGGQLQYLLGVDPGYQKESQLLAAGHFTSVNHQQLVAATQLLKPGIRST